MSLLSRKKRKGAFVFIGSIAGGYAVGHLLPCISLGSWTWSPAFMLHFIFIISGIMRMAATGIFIHRFKEVRPVEPVRHRDLIFRVSHIRPIAGATFSLFTGLFRERKETKHVNNEKDSSPK